MGWALPRVLEGLSTSPVRRALLVAACVLPVLLLSGLGAVVRYRETTESLLSQRSAFIHLAATSVDERLDKYALLAQSLSTRPAMMKAVSARRWEEGLGVLLPALKDAPEVASLFLTDPAGDLKAAYPAAPGARGESFASSDWYVGVSKGWRPYVSSVYQQARDPHSNVVAVAVPIRQDGKVIGVLVLQILADTFHAWAREAGAAPPAILYILDQKSQLVAHPGHAPQGPVADYSSDPVAAALRGQARGVGVLRPAQGEGVLAAYELLPDFGWGVALVEPAASAFALRRRALLFLVLASGLAVLATAAAAWLFLQLVASRQAAADYVRSLIEASLDPLVTIAPDGRIMDANTAAGEALGLPRRGLIGTDFAAYFTQPAQARAGYERVFKDGVIRGLPLRLRSLREGGLEVPVLYNASVYRDQAGRVQGVFAAARDVSDLSRAQKALQEANDLLVAANKELEAFSYSVSHDLRAPLRAVDGFARMLLEEHGARLDAEGKRVCGVIGEGARNMGKLIDDLLAFSRVGRTPMRSSTLDMAGMARSIFFEATTPESRARIDFRVGPLPSCAGDPALMRQVWMNLLSNAVKFTSKKARAVIEVGFETKGEAVVYSVRDDGAGFDMRYAGKLFGVFQRLHGTKEFEGTGVGLAVVQRIILRHGGRVWAHGEVDKGATFSFTLSKGG